VHTVWRDGDRVRACRTRPTEYDDHVCQTGRRRMWRPLALSYDSHFGTGASSQVGGFSELATGRVQVTVVPQQRNRDVSARATSPVSRWAEQAQR
jgi:hypothetical protein